MSVCIDGNIGAGKSTLLAELSRRGYRCFPEPLEKWSSLLKKMGANHSRWAFTFQMMVLETLISRARWLAGNVVFFVERCPISSLVFAATAKKLNYMSAEEYALFLRIYSRLVWLPQRRIQLVADLNVYHSRIVERARPGEEAISTEYLALLEAAYDTHPAHKINCDQPVKTLADEVLTYLGLPTTVLVV